jgi:hypothetical protein
LPPTARTVTDNSPAIALAQHGEDCCLQDDVGAFVMTFQDFPPRAFPPSFNPTNMLDETLDDIKDNRAKAGERAKSIDRSAAA